VDRPLLSLDRPFTYDLSPDLGAGVGSLVRFRFHGKLTKGWVLGPAEDVPDRMLPVMRLVSPEPVFDGAGLELARWVSTRYVAPLATVIGRMSPPRVAGVEALPAPAAQGMGAAPAQGPYHAADPLLSRYRGGEELAEAIRSGGGGAFVLRPAPRDEAGITVEAVALAVSEGKRAIVIVPEASPMPFTARASLDTFGERVANLVGGTREQRYRTWLMVRAGLFDIVVGTRPAIFAPLPNLGLIWICRESHPAHREDRAPYYHVREVALARARIEGATCVLAALCPSSEASILGLGEVSPVDRRWPRVEQVSPGPEGRAPRLVRALRQARRAFVYSPIPGYGVAQVCRTCGEPAACPACGGLIRLEAGAFTCMVCGAAGRCAACGATRFGVRRGGAERVEEWIASVAEVPVRSMPRSPRLPSERGEILVGGPDSVRDLGTGDLDLVAILDADLAARRPGLMARERALAVWMEAVAWTSPGGRALVQASQGSDPAVQALVRGNPIRFHERERERRASAGFPVGSAIFRVVGDPRLGDAIRTIPSTNSLVSTLGGRTVCLLALAPGQVPGFGAAMRQLATTGVVERVEADPHL
jgi:primosomal protein N' (replication factor Y)